METMARLVTSKLKNSKSYYLTQNLKKILNKQQYRLSGKQLQLGIRAMNHTN